jgi:2-aminomuconate deaminase
MGEDRGGGHLVGAPQFTQYSRVKAAGGLLFVAGISSRQPDNTVIGAQRDATGALTTDVRAQTAGAIENLAAVLAAWGATIEDVVDVTVFLVDMADYDGFNEAWNRYFTTSGPARTTVAVHQLPDPQLVVELKAIARQPTGGAQA